MTVLQSAEAPFSAGFSQRPCTVITGASGGTLEASAGAAMSESGEFGRVVRLGLGGLDWPTARTANNIQAKPFRTILKSASKEVKRIIKES
jgi:hypothetical protein